jgi:hypothetical protein
MPISEAQLNANRENAKHSSGPRTETSKQKVRMNALKHGYSGHLIFVPEHEKDSFLRHLENFRAEYNPKGITEEVLVQSLCDISWSMQQMRSESANILAMSGSQPHNFPGERDAEQDYALSQVVHADHLIKSLNLLGIYENRKARLFNATRRELVQVQSERRANEKAEREAAKAAQPVERPATNTAAHTATPAPDGFVCSEPKTTVLPGPDHPKTMAA